MLTGLDGPSFLLAGLDSRLERGGSSLALAQLLADAHVPARGPLHEADRYLALLEPDGDALLAILAPRVWTFSCHDFTPESDSMVEYKKDFKTNFEKLITRRQVLYRTDGLPQLLLGDVWDIPLQIPVYHVLQVI